MRVRIVCLCGISNNFLQKVVCYFSEPAIFLAFESLFFMNIVNVFLLPNFKLYIKLLIILTILSCYEKCTC